MSLFRSPYVFLLAFAVIGCGQRAVKPEVSQSENSAVDGKGRAAPASATSDDVLTSALFQLQPENFGINSTTDKPVSLLNSWRYKRIEQGIVEQPVPASAPSGWVAADDETRLAQPKFDFTDAVHIRDSLFFHHIAGYLSDRGREELQRVAIVVDFVCRNVALWKDDEIEIPLTPFASTQFGRGTADDRAWICAEIFRQLRIDSIVLRANTDVKETTEKWLLGVLVERKVYLFDLRLGLPVSNGSGDKGTAPAALDEVVAHPELLEKMAASGAYRLKIDDLRDPAVFVITEPNFWCDRMHSLEQALPASDTCVLYDPVSGKEGYPGLLERVATAGGWAQDSLKLWTYPHQQHEAALHPVPGAAQELQRLSMPFNVPYPFKMGDDGKPVIGAPERKLQRIRTDQLQGKFSDATQRYLSIRHLEVERNPPDLERLNRMASEDAFYWTGLCKFELADYAGAVDQLSAYLKKYDRKGKWFFSARSLLAQSYALQGQLAEAVSTLERTSSDDPYQSANAIRVKRWAAARSQ